MNPTKLPAWQKLTQLANKKINLTDAFKSNPTRATDLSIQDIGITYDYSKNLVDAEVMQALLELYTESRADEHVASMFAGQKINFTEQRAVLHTALRAKNNNLNIDGVEVQLAVDAELAKLYNLVDQLHAGKLVGHSGKPINTIVNIGIGGSHLGPEMVALSLRSFHQQGITAHFVANVDPADIESKLAKISYEQTLFIVASKTFTTLETITNAQIARQWLIGKYNGDEASVGKHFIALSTNEVEVTKFGIDSNNMFKFWDFVGGRYSIWSVIGAPVAMLVGRVNFENFLKGANEVDQHLKNTPAAKNIPVLMALLGIWYRNFLGKQSLAVLPYSHDLRLFANYLQQLEMESNGKQVDKENAFITDYQTAGVIWGGEETNGQHAFHQLLHQGTDYIPLDFIGFLNTKTAYPEQHKQLLANMIAQAEALMVGRDLLNEPHRHFSGNRPSTIILADELSPESIGKLIALYEHKVLIQGAIWNINSFDQFGVELGKEMAKRISSELASGLIGEHDPSTTAFLKQLVN